MDYSSSPFRDSIRREQARTAIDALPITLGASLAILISTTSVLWLYSRGHWIIPWALLSAAITLYRGWDGHRVKAEGLVESDPAEVLRGLTRQAILAGCTWAILPLAYLGQLETVAGAFIAFIVAGTAAGALIQNTAYAPPAVGFYLPALTSVAMALLVSLTPASIVISFNVLLLAFMMMRQSYRSERAYWQSEHLRHEATELAASLAEANRQTVAANARLHTLARHDTLTQLHNRAALNDELEMRLASVAAFRHGLALVVVDLDNFKVINDTQGHGAGDSVLQEASRRILSCCLESDFVARLGGDEFAILLAGPDALNRAVDLSRRAIEAIASPVVIEERRATVGASIGIALFPEDAVTPIDLLASADIALYAAKQAGRRRYAQFDAVMKQRLDAKRRLESDLGDALEAGQLDVVFQPQIDLATGRTIGHEALIRWAHPQLGDVPPPDIVAAAQDTHLSSRLTGYVVDAACELLNALDRLGDRTSILSVNVSPNEFRLGSPAGVVLERIAAKGIDPRRIEVEITEEAILDAKAAGNDLARLDAAGIRLAIDDFGAGHFSLSDTISLDIDRIKIDRSFVSGIDLAERQQMLVDTVLALARKLGVEVLAEGVETRAEADTLIALGCRQAQGFLYATPISAAATLERAKAERTAGTGPAADTLT